MTNCIAVGPRASVLANALPQHAYPATRFLNRLKEVLEGIDHEQHILKVVDLERLVEYCVE